MSSVSVRIWYQLNQVKIAVNSSQAQLNKSEISSTNHLFSLRLIIIVMTTNVKPEFILESKITYETWDYCNPFYKYDDTYIYNQKSSQFKFQRQEQENQGYSKHGPEIIEGRQETKIDTHSDTYSVCDNDTVSASGKHDSTDTLNVLIGASICTRLGETDENLLNASKSGANYESFTQILDFAVQKSDSFKVNKVAICFGTNDINKHKDGSDQINLLVTKAVAQVKSTYPESQVGLCSIIPRKGNSAQIKQIKPIGNKC